MPAGDPPFDLISAQSDGVSPVSTGGTITFQYPVIPTIFRDIDLVPSSYDSTNTINYADPTIMKTVNVQRCAAHYANGRAKLSVRALQAVFTEGSDFTVAYGPTNITVTYNGATQIPGSATITLQAPITDTSGAPTDTFAQPIPDPLTAL